MQSVPNDLRPTADVLGECLLTTQTVEALCTG
jgi:hypothetical protein